jgi:hypothetical protein
MIKAEIGKSTKRRHLFFFMEILKVFCIFMGFGYGNLEIGIKRRHLFS